MATLVWNNVQDLFTTVTLDIYQCKACPHYATIQRDKGMAHILAQHASVQNGMIVVVNNNPQEVNNSDSLLEICNQCEIGLERWCDGLQASLPQKQFVDAATEMDLNELVTTNKPVEESLPEVKPSETEKTSILESAVSNISPPSGQTTHTLPVSTENDDEGDDVEDCSGDLVDFVSHSPTDSPNKKKSEPPASDTYTTTQTVESSDETLITSEEDSSKSKTQTKSPTRPGLRSPAKRKRKIFHDYVQDDNHLTSSDTNVVKSEALFECDKCDCSTDTKKTLTSHLSTHTGKKTKQVVCVKCNTQFSNKRGLILHNKVCEGKGSDTENIAEGVKKDKDDQNKDEQRPCPVCDFMCKSERGYKIHMHKHAEKRKSRTFECNECNKKFTSKLGMSKHKRDGWCRKGVPKIYKRYTCNICDKEFHNKGIYQEHLTVHSAIRSHTCDVCQRTFKTARALKRHHGVHEGEPLKCNLCDFTTYWKTSLKTHFVGKHASESRPLHQCPHCTFTTRSAMYISKHIMLHSDERPFMCEECGKSFKSDVVLRAHREIHSDKMYPCDKCDYVGRTKAAIYNHQVCHIPKDQMQYKCTHCDWVGKRNLEYQVHLRKHSDMKLFRCGHCGHSYKHKQGLTRHLKEKHMVQASVIPEVIFPDDELGSQEASLALSSLPVAQFFEISTEILADTNS